jgi:hypothetical protein
MYSKILFSLDVPQSKETTSEGSYKEMELMNALSH